VFNPLRDGGLTYSNESRIVTTVIDMGSMDLPKAFTDMSIISKNLDADTDIRVEYQTDNDIGTATWTYLGTITQSPKQILPIGLSGKTRIRYRLFLRSAYATEAPVVYAVITEGFARLPVAYIYEMRIRIGSLQLTKIGTPDSKPDDFLAWMKRRAGDATLLTMRSNFFHLDNKRVVIEPPTVRPKYLLNELEQWGAWVYLTLREV
jgi:hypothetical protein